MKENTPELLAAYVPVLHQGYVDMFDRHPGATIGVFDRDVTDLFGYLKKDIRVLKPETAVRAIEGLGRTARFLGQASFQRIALESETALIMPDDDVSRGVIEMFDVDVNRVTFEPVFLRWDRRNVAVNQEAEPDASINASLIDQDIIALLRYEHSRGTNSWRQVGAVATKNGAVVGSAHNHSLPTQYTSALDADPRNTANRGTAIEISNDIHAESEVIARAAKAGHSLEHTDMYVSTFPCPNCAKLIATAGIARCFYAEGYAMLDGQTVMKSAGIELIKIDGLEFDDDESSRRPYPPK